MKIKTVSIDAIDSLSSVIYSKLEKSIALEKIKEKISAKLCEIGSKNFILEYNKVVATNDFEKFI